MLGIDTISVALRAIASLSDIAKNIKDAEVRQELNGKIADLQGTLISARQAMLDLQDKYELVLRENKQLKEATVPKQKPSGRRWGCYQFEGEDGLFCTACYDTKGLKSQTTRMSSRYRSCPVCRATIGDS